MLSVSNPSISSAEDVILSLQSDAESGLNMGEAAARLHTYGHNKFEIDEKVHHIHNNRANTIFSNIFCQ